MNRLATAAALVLLAAAPVPALAQGGLSAGHLGAGFGVSFPTGSLSDRHSSGFNLTGTAEYQAPGQPMGVRGEIFYEHFSAKTGVAGARSAQTTAALVSAVYNVEGTSVHPYFIGGMGIYSVTGGGTHPGFSGGVGIRIPLTGMTAYFEARLHKVLTDGSSYLSLPVTFGLSF
ncbi:MAG: outer membrane beta-barrel protein [Gemmatimonadota bacterium]|nr:outer membrane beta-barrel protein [Gemmatimonadota bacterium]MDE3172294.1 outer membrane beta-barrel protein [Gemmatimonadota bacterium]MDE3215277.1 outer membrane beta-barrel protein [Gemmatimonadota bacterium]